MSRSRSIAAVLPLALAAAIAGCGGGADEVTAAELVQQGDQICDQERAEFARIQATPPANATEAADQTKQVIDASESATSDLEDMEPPEALQTTYDLYLEARQEAIDEMKKGQDAAEEQDSAAYGAAQEAVVKGAPERQRLARALGFKSCSKSPEAP